MRRSPGWIPALASLGLILAGAPVVAQDCLDYGDYHPDAAPTGPRIADEGRVQAMAVSGTVLCLGTDTGIQLWDVSDPLAPLWLGEAPVWCDRLVAHGDVLYAARYTRGLQVIDIEDPTAPEVTEVLRHERGTFDLVVHREHLYLTSNLENLDDFFGVVVYDLVDPRHPALVGEFHGGAGFNVCRSGDDLILTNYDPVYADRSFLTAVDLSDPASPAYYGEWLDYAGRTRDVAAHGDHVYAVTDTQGLYVIDVADPTQPTIVRVMPELAPSWNVAVVDGTLWVVVRGPGDQNTLVALSLVDPTAPQLLEGAAFSGDPRYHAAAGGWFYLATDAPSPVLVDIADPAQPAVQPWTGAVPGRYFMTAAGAAGLGDLVYVGSGVGYPLQVFDVADLDVPQKVAAVPGDLAGGGVALSDTLLCQLVHDPDGDSRRWLDLYSVADPRQPRSLARGEIGAYARYLAATEGVAYAAGYYDIHVMDLSDPAQPQNVKSLNPPGSGAMRSIMVEGQFLYAACNSSGLVIYDLADPLDPYLAATVPLAACQAAAVQGDLCIAVDWYRGLCTIDVSDPAVPVILHEETLEQVATWTAALDGGHFLLVNEFAEGWIYDVTDPLAPQLQGGFDAIALPWTVTVAGRWLAMAHGTQGLQLAWRACPVTVAVPPETPAATPRLAVAPNPFNPRTTITFSIVRAGEVAVSVHDLAGRRVARLVEGWRAEGTHAVGWNGRDEDGGGVPSGAYLVRLRTADGVRSVKMMLVR